ncbi:MAG TPA: murein L,D-transpeptidase catalytic domain family protein [Myxococcota bacterium]
MLKRPIAAVSSLFVVTLALTACGTELDTDAGHDTGELQDTDALVDGEGDGPFVDDSSEDVGDEDNQPPADPDFVDDEVAYDEEGQIVDADAPACPPGAVCITEVPFRATTSTVGGTDRFDRYNCGTQNESGPERIYRVELPGAGTLSVSLDGSLESGGTDVDVHILSSLSANACVARGDRSASAAFSASTEYVYVVFDSFQRSNGTNGAGRFSGLISWQGLPSASRNPLLSAGVPPAVAELAMVAWQQAEDQDLTDSPIFTIIDFSKPSNERRLWTVNTDTGALLASHRVTHGIGSSSSSDKKRATSFSNVSGSNKSSLGLSRTAETYSGNHGYSLRLDGLEASNSRMRSRAIVVHGADYAEDSFATSNGYLGRSNGCPAIAQTKSRAFINIIKGGTLIFSYYPSSSWLNSSEFLN